MIKDIFKNQYEELMQKTAWRLVRSSEDRFGSGRGDEKRVWAITRMAEEFPKEKPQKLEDHIRAAFFNFKIEARSLAF